MFILKKTGSFRNFNRCNVGFSLVEVLMSITVLSIIVLPISSVFLSSANLTARSAKLDSAVQLAQNIAEQLQSMQLNSIDASYNESAPILSGTQGVFVTPNSNTPEHDYIAVDEASTPAQGEFIYIEYKGVAAGTASYNAVVTISNNSDNYNYNSINSAELFESIPMDYVTAQSRRPQYDTDEMAWQAFLIECANMGYDVADEEVFKQRVSTSASAGKLTTFNVENIENSMHVTVNYNYSFAYPAPQGGEIITRGGEIITSQSHMQNQNAELSQITHSTLYTWPNSNNNATAQATLTPPKGVKLPESEDELTAFYLMYYPWYYTKDEFVINNYSDIPLNLLLVKQRDSTIPQSELYVKEINYKPSVTINESEKSTMQTILHTNMGQNIESSTGGQINVQYIFAATTFEPKSIAEKKSANRMYSITVEIFEIDETGESAYSSGTVYKLTSAKLE